MIAGSDSRPIWISCDSLTSENSRSPVAGFTAHAAAAISSAGQTRRTPYFRIDHSVTFFGMPRFACFAGPDLESSSVAVVATSGWQVIPVRRGVHDKDP